MADILQTKPSDWEYVSEGGATIVFSYTGPSHPDFDGRVLRLRKSVALLQSLKRKAQPTEDEPDDPTIEYQTRCMQRLIPPEHLPRLQSLQLHRSWLEELVELHNTARPEERRTKDEVDLKRKKGVLATDLVGGNWLAVEIKPKWAFLPSPVHLSEETKVIKTKTCRFCMHSYLRAQQSKREVTDYCPLDLFSGDEPRITKAVHSLWDAWVVSNATANNLKIFARGKFVTPSEAHIMLSENETVGHDLSAIRDTFASALVQRLLHTPVLRILSELQRNLDVLDIEGLSKLWRLTETSAPLYRETFSSFFEQTPEGSESAPPSTPLGSPEPNISDWADFVETYISPNKPELDHSSPSPENLRYYLLSYLLSATFKDCSIIAKLDFLRPSAHPQVEITPGSLTLIDLDPKSMAKLKGWEKLDQEIVRTYASSQKKTCIDAWQVRGSTSN
ncbi:inositol-pentakisphosphate 2-kinase [Flammula alnicola]|nr:inositol-pentakisphosphate 2-kinase [Flammula alnicola]